MLVVFKLKTQLLGLEINLVNKKQKHLMIFLEKLTEKELKEKKRVTLPKQRQWKLLISFLKNGKKD